MSPLFIEPDSHNDSWSNQAHWNERGQNLAARAIEQFLKYHDLMLPANPPVPLTFVDRSFDDQPRHGGSE